MSIASGLEIRRRRRTGGHLAVPAAVLVCAVLLSLAAQVIQAEPTPIGWIAAAVPAAGFLTMVKIALGYHPTPTGDRPSGRSAPDKQPDTAESGTVPGTRPPTTDRPPPPSGPDRTGDAADVQALIPAARQAAGRITAAGAPLTRGGLAEALRADGFAVSTARASALIKILKADETPNPAPEHPTSESLDR